jgi:hypothetical protein
MMDDDLIGSTTVRLVGEVDEAGKTRKYELDTGGFVECSLRFDEAYEAITKEQVVAAEAALRQAEQLVAADEKQDALMAAALQAQRKAEKMAAADEEGGALLAAAAGGATAMAASFGGATAMAAAAVGSALSPSHGSSGGSPEKRGESTRKASGSSSHDSGADSDSASSSSSSSSSSGSSSGSEEDDEDSTETKSPQAKAISLGAMVRLKRAAQRWRMQHSKKNSALMWEYGAGTTTREAGIQKMETALVELEKGSAPGIVANSTPVASPPLLLAITGLGGLLLLALLALGLAWNMEPSPAQLQTPTQCTYPTKQAMSDTTSAVACFKPTDGTFGLQKGGLSLSTSSLSIVGRGLSGVVGEAVVRVRRSTKTGSGAPLGILSLDTTELERNIGNGHANRWLESDRVNVTWVEAEHALIVGGQAPADVYQAILRSVRYTHTFISPKKGGEEEQKGRSSDETKGVYLNVHVFPSSGNSTSSRSSSANTTLLFKSPAKKAKAKAKEKAKEKEKAKAKEKETPKTTGWFGDSAETKKGAKKGAKKGGKNEPKNEAKPESSGFFYGGSTPKSEAHEEKYDSSAADPTPTPTPRRKPAAAQLPRKKKERAQKPNVPPTLDGVAGRTVWQLEEAGSSGADGTVIIDGEVMASGLAVAPIGLQLKDEDDAELQLASVEIINSYNISNDRLYVAKSALPASLEEFWDSESGILEITGAASLSVYERVLRQVKFTTTNTEETKRPQLRTVQFFVSDGKSESAGGEGTFCDLQLLPARTQGGGGSSMFGWGGGEDGQCPTDPKAETSKKRAKRTQATAASLKGRAADERHALDAALKRLQRLVRSDDVQWQLRQQIRQAMGRQVRAWSMLELLVLGAVGSVATAICIIGVMHVGHLRWQCSQSSAWG